MSSTATAAKLRRVSLPEKAGLPLATKPLADSDAEFEPMVWLVGAHGGAGVTSLSKVLAPCGDAGQQWPDQDESPWCVIVARATRTGVEAAHDVALQAQVGKNGRCRVIGVILVADAPGKTPKAVEQRATVIGKVVPNIWHVPYFSEWCEVLTSELPEWSPLEDDDDAADENRRFGRRKKGPSAVEVVPKNLRLVGWEIVDRVREAHAHL
ncbi:DUF6668 family protein [Corynebacterium sanguinis]|uniref:Uncharacterized protein n=1 Tax=Corynebacterium sanguinis TaxID=2594913 RepID=A0A6C1TZK5_9CORY|nr:DUF6668 family protein [Corynebacterium sanguinis]TVS26968.1 hypothetical protein EKI59_09725 [Corynebacterium sanguinis]